MYRFLFYISMIILASCTAGRQIQQTPGTTTLQLYVDSVGKQYAPDKRIVLYNITVQGNVLKGETGSVAAKDALLSQLNSAKITFIDSIAILPAYDVIETVGVITLSVANLRTHPSHKAELATQATMGVPLKVYKRQRGWYMVQTPENYIAWIDGGGLKLMQKEQWKAWKALPKIIFQQPYGIAYTTTDKRSTVTDLVYGCIMAVTSESGEQLKILLPDGREGYVDKAAIMNYNEWKQTREPAAENIIAASKQMMGVPYLWGGTSFKGVDCSGFTKTAFFMNGLVLPRDASQQVTLGEEIDIANGFDQLQPGDLLFFGSKANANNPERVVHVGIWIGKGEFIHASGMVQVASLIPTAANYDAQEHRRLIKAKRITPANSLYDLRYKDFLSGDAF